MKMRTLTATLIILIGFFAVFPVSATSLFDEEGCDLFTSMRASEIGDLVTIIVSEQTSATNRASTETNKKLNTDGELTVTGFLQWIAGFPEQISPIEDLTFTPKEQFSGSGRVQTQANFTAKLTAVVVDTLPNGNLVIEGTREISIAEDTATLGIRGVIRETDISSDNTINSWQISEMEIIYKGDGIVAERQKDGILSRIFNFFF